VQKPLGQYIQAACLHNLQFIAISGDSQPSYTHIAKFVRELGDEVQSLFTQVLLTCDRLCLIRREMFAIDGVNLRTPSLGYSKRI
jgi:hypothetical protein